MEFSNHLLCELPLAIRREAALLGNRVSLEAGATLQLQGEPQRCCWFVEAGIVSLSRVQADGCRREAALVGREGFVGTLLGEAPSFTEARVEIGGTAMRFDARVLQDFAAREPAVQDVLARYQGFQLDEAQLNAACNATHGAAQRLAKWLLRCLDRVDEPKIPLTQEALAEMLGVQRTTVTGAIRKLTAQGAVKNGRGLIEVIDRRRLKALACECYEEAAERLPELGLPEPSDESACAA